MAYYFDRFSSYSLRCDGIDVASYPLTISARMNTSMTSTQMFMVALGSATAQSPSQGVGIGSVGNVIVRSQTGISNSLAVVVGPTPANNGNWHHAAGVFSAANNRVPYFNGLAGTPNTVSRAQATLNSVHIGTRVGLTDGFMGSIAEVGVWNAALNPDEIMSLSDGMTCDKVRPQSLVFYAPLVRDLIDVKGGLTFVMNNSPYPVDHPRVYA